MADDRWSELCDQWEKDGYDSLSRPEKTWLNIRTLIDSIENGGAISYFYNSGADTLADCLEDLRILEAASVRAQVERVAGLFPEGVPGDIEARNAIIVAWPDEEVEPLLEEVDDELMPLMSSLEQRLDEFLERSGLAT
ncbi:MAG: DUF4375 domain-containing protein [Thermoanaerobaculia bacterium]|nr:DUF4375 domain-containing protein [Thermoanaerobaculia bacterium]